MAAFQKKKKHLIKEGREARGNLVTMCDSGLYARSPGVPFREMNPQLQGVLAAEQMALS